MTLLNFSLGLRKCIQHNYTPLNSSVQTRMQHSKSMSPLFISVMTYPEFTGNSTIVWLDLKI